MNFTGYEHGALHSRIAPPCEHRAIPPHRFSFISPIRLDSVQPGAVHPGAQCKGGLRTPLPCKRESTHVNAVQHGALHFRIAFRPTGSASFQRFDLIQSSRAQCTPERSARADCAPHFHANANPRT